MDITGVGVAEIKFNDNLIPVKNVLHVPDLSISLLSVSQTVKLVNTVVFNDGNTMRMLSRESNDSALIRHRRLAHINYQDMCRIKN